MSKEVLLVDAMIGLCVHEPNTLIDPPGNVKQFFENVLNDHFDKVSLSPIAKVGFLMTQGAMSFAESEKVAWKDLPDQILNFMTSNSLDPNAYEMKTFSEDLGKNLKILFIAAFHKDTLSEKKN